MQAPATNFFIMTLPEMILCYITSGSQDERMLTIADSQDDRLTLPAA